MQAITRTRCIEHIDACAVYINRNINDVEHMLF